MAQPGKQVVDGSDDQPGSVAIPDVGRVNRDPDQQAGGVGDDVALAAFDLLRRIVAARPAAFGGLDRLAVDHPRRGAWLAAGGVAGLQQSSKLIRSNSPLSRQW